MASPAETLKARIRADLTSSMKVRDSDKTRLLRVLLAALDNAEAVPVGTGHDRYVERPFGDPSVEVPRHVLSVEEVAALLERERAERDGAAAAFEGLGRSDDAEGLRQEALWVAGYLQAPGAR